MRKVISLTLLLSLALTVLASATPLTPARSAQTTLDSHVLSSATLAAVTGGTLACALGLAGEGLGLIAAGLSGPVGWVLFGVIVAQAGTGIAAACIPQPL